MICRFNRGQSVLRDGRGVRLQGGGGGGDSQLGRKRAPSYPAIDSNRDRSGNLRRQKIMRFVERASKLSSSQHFLFQGGSPLHKQLT